MGIPFSNQTERHRIDRTFCKLIKKKFPDKSFRQATKELNKVLEDMLWGPKKL